MHAAEPPAAHVPAPQGFAVATPVPAGQKWPAGHSACIVFAERAGQ